MSTSYCEQSSRTSNEYSGDSSDYSSSVVTTNTPFPSSFYETRAEPLTKSQKVKLNEILHREPIGYVSTFTHESDGWEVIPDVKPDVKPEVKEEAKDEEIKNSCCCLC